MAPPSLAGAIAALPVLPNNRKDLSALHLAFDRPLPEAWLARLPEGSETKLLLLAGHNMEVPLAKCTYVGLGIVGNQLAVPGCVKVRVEEVYTTPEALQCYGQLLQKGTELWVPYGVGRLLKLDGDVDQPQQQQQSQQQQPAVTQLQHQPAGSQLQAAHAVSTPAAQPTAQQQQRQQLQQQQLAQPATVATGWVTTAFMWTMIVAKL